MSRSTRAHTVPRFYLGGFTAQEGDPNHEPFVWFGLLATGTIQRRSPKNVSIVRGFYDGPGGFANPDASIENHLSGIESEAAFAIRRFASISPGDGASPSPAIWRFLSWQAARTPAWFRLVEEWANEADDVLGPVVELPPDGFERISDRPRTHWVEDPVTGNKHGVQDLTELKEWQKRGWKWKLSAEDRLEAMHLQAWYFQVRHFPRLHWTRLNCPKGECFITSDRAIAWLVDGIADTPPAALRHPTAQVVAPLTREIALVGRNATSSIGVTPREVNRVIAFAATEWIAGPTRAAVEQAMADRDLNSDK